ncbi:MAG: phenylalanine--tRNA ligase subunit alpha [Deltaproteobacteria bacterium]|nr:phenylalanine--tRNA ligase subunit alpha [Deltaproteobacteria bacterium]
MASEASREIELALAALGERFRAAFDAASGEGELRAARAAVLGKKGDLTLALRRLGEVPGPERRAVGERVNAVKAEVESAFEARLVALRQAARQAELDGPPHDLTLPPRRPAPRGHVHPLTQVRLEMLDIFRAIGFDVAVGPEVELEANNFTKLAFPPDHPAMDMQDSFWVDVAGAPEGARTLLRTHTSNVQIREMSRRTPPMAVVSGGAVYRRDDDVTHSPMFHQVEGFAVSETANFAELRGVLTLFAERLYGRRVGLRFRPSYFPFVEPGAEVDVECVFCDSAVGVCRVCKGTRWVEVLGCGMVHPDVLGHCGIDAERYRGYAFGLGVERVAMLRYGIPDMRLLFENDPRFLAQF